MEKGLKLGLLQRGESHWEYVEGITFPKKGEEVDHKSLSLK